MKRQILPFSLFALGMLILYGHTATFGFVHWDDYSYLHDNELLSGSFIHIIENIFSSFRHGNYFPLHLLSYSIELKLAGLTPAVFHTTNIMLHFANVCLLYTFFNIISRDSRVSFIGALFLASHPVHVESVAWISERKDTLFLFFFLLTLISYFRYLQRNKKYLLYISWIVYICSLLSKSTAVVLPLLLIITMWYKFSSKIIKTHIASIIIFFIYAFVVCIIQIIGGTSYGVWSDGYNLRIIVNTVFTYIFHLTYPIGLSPHYSAIADIHITGLISIVLCLVILLSVSKNFRWALLWFIYALLPVLNIIPIQIVMADRYLYLPACALYFYMSDWLISLYTAQKTGYLRKIILISVVAMFCALFILTFAQTKTWRTTESIWKRAMNVQPNDPIPLIQLGIYASINRNDRLSAQKYFTKAYAIAPSNSEVLYNMGLFMLDTGKLRNAEDFLHRATLTPNSRKRFVSALLPLAMLYSIHGKFSAENRILNYLGHTQSLNPHIINKLKENMLYQLELEKRINHAITAKQKIKDHNLTQSIWNLQQAGGLRDSMTLLTQLEHTNYISKSDLIFIQSIYLYLYKNTKLRPSIIMKGAKYNIPFFSYILSLLRANMAGHILDKNYFLDGIKNFSAEPLFWLESGIYYARVEHDYQAAKECYETLIKREYNWIILPRVISLRKILIKKNALLHSKILIAQ